MQLMKKKNNLSVSEKNEKNTILSAYKHNLKIS